MRIVSFPVAIDAHFDKSAKVLIAPEGMRTSLGAAPTALDAVCMSSTQPYPCGRSSDKLSSPGRGVLTKWAMRAAASSAWIHAMRAFGSKTGKKAPSKAKAAYLAGAYAPAERA